MPAGRDAMVLHGPGEGPVALGGIRRAAGAAAPAPLDGGDESSYLAAAAPGATGPGSSVGEPAAPVVNHENMTEPS